MNGLFVDARCDIRDLLEATVIVFDPYPLTILDIVFFSGFRMDHTERLRMQFSHRGQLTMLRMEELKASAAASEDEWILFHKFGCGDGSLGGLGMEWRGFESPILEERGGKLDTS